MSTPEPAPAYLDPLHNELDRLRNREQDAIQYEHCIAWDTTCSNCADVLDASYQQYVRAEDADRRADEAEARVDQLTDTLTLRSDALNRTGATNDQLRATLARVRKLADFWDDEPYPNTHDAGWNNGYNMRCESDANDLRAILDEQEPNA